MGVTAISTYTIHFFAGLAEHAGVRAVEITSTKSLTVKELKTLVAERFPDLRSQIETALVAIDQSYAQDTQEITNGQEIAFIPPVGGGAPEERHFYRITDAPLEVSEAMGLLEDVYCGGTALFCGTVREFTGTKRTTHLSYEAYESMALEQMHRIAEDIEQEYPGVRTLQWHRIGELFPTDIAVICAAASPHRDNAFAAARTLIERLKKEVPIWKKEYFADGDSIWQANEQ